ncbi:MAG: hypothetical protein AB8H03_24050 [Saprospiraceae bacterium]
MKILIVSASFFPENSPRSFRTTELVKEFCRQGHHVKLITASNSVQYDDMMEKYRFEIKKLPKTKLPSFNWKGKISNIIRRGLEILFEYPNIEFYSSVKKALKTEKGFDLMISIAAPHSIHWGVAAATKKFGKAAKIWIADCGDPFMGSKMDRIGKPFYFKYLEKSFCKNADFITVPIEGAREAYYSEFRKKIIVIPQGFKFSETQGLLEEYQSNSVISFAYAGALSRGGRDPRPILEVLKKSERDFRFYIFTNASSILSPYDQELKDKIIVSPYIPRKDLIKKLSKMDFLLNLENGVSEQLPSKLIDYYLIGRPVLSLNSGHLDKTKLLDFLNRDFSAQYQFQNVSQYEVQNVVESFINLGQAKR